MLILISMKFILQCATDSKSAMLQVMTWVELVPDHCLNHWRLNLLSPFGPIRDIGTPHVLHSLKWWSPLSLSIYVRTTYYSPFTNMKNVQFQSLMDQANPTRILCSSKQHDYVTTHIKLFAIIFMGQFYKFQNAPVPYPSIHNNWTIIFICQLEYGRDRDITDQSHKFQNAPTPYTAIHSIWTKIFLYQLECGAYREIRHMRIVWFFKLVCCCVVIAGWQNYASVLLTNIGSGNGLLHDSIKSLLIDSCCIHFSTPNHSNNQWRLFVNWNFMSKIL